MLTQGLPSDLLNQIWTGPYLLIRQVVSSLASVEMEVSVFPRDLVSHGTFKGTVVDQGHREVKEVVDEKVTGKLLRQTTPTTFGLIGSRESGMPHDHISRPTSPPFTITTYHATITPL